MATGTDELTLQLLSPQLPAENWALLKRHVECRRVVDVVIAVVAKRGAAEAEAGLEPEVDGIREVVVGTEEEVANLPA